MPRIEFDHTYYMKQALIQAGIARDNDEVPVGAVIVCREKIIARAYNMTETLNDVTAHAEMQAFTAAENFLGAKYLNDCTLYVTLEPCAMCAGAAYWTQIGGIVYGTGDEKRGYRLINPDMLHPKTKVMGGILEKECRGLLSGFFNTKR
ncbi:MAG: nucleoside deaminase [Bacteroidales bacterium]